MKTSISTVLPKHHASELEILFFKTSWSGMSSLAERGLINVLSRLKKTKNLKIIDIEENPELSKIFGVYEVPSLLFLYNKNVCGRLDKMVNENEIGHYMVKINNQIRVAEIKNKHIQTED